MKGHTNNPNGRPSGTPNKITGALKDKINRLVEDNIDKIQEDLGKVDPKDRVNILIKLMEFVLPKQKETKIDFNSLSDDEIDQLIQKIIHEKGNKN